MKTNKNDDFVAKALIAAALDPYDKVPCAKVDKREFDEFDEHEFDGIDLEMERLLEATREAQDVLRATKQHKLKVICVLEGTEDEIDDAYELLENLDCPALKCVYEGDWL